MTKEEEYRERKRLEQEVDKAKEAEKTAKVMRKFAEASLKEFNAKCGPRCEIVKSSDLARFGTWNVREVFKKLDKERYET